MLPEPPAPAVGRTGARASVQAALIALLAWAALLCAGLGAAVGVNSQTLAGKLAAAAQVLQRQAGASSASRTLRRELPAVAAGLKVAEATHATREAIELHGDGALPAGAIALPLTPRGASGRPKPAAVEADLGPRDLTPPSRAPPPMA